MATEYGNPKFRDSNKNLPFTMNGQPAIDALARVVNTVGASNITISNTGFSSNSDYSKTHNNSVNYDKIINSTSKTYRINWKLKSNVGTHPRKTTSLEYGLLSWFNGGTEGKSNNPVTYTSTSHQLKGTNNFDPSRILTDLRYFDANIRVNGLDGNNNKEVIFNTASSFAGDNKQIKGIAQGYYNYDAPYTVFTANSPVNWVSFQTANGSTSNNISITSSSGDISTGSNAHYLIISDNSPSVLYGDISGAHTVHYNIDKDANGNSISNTHAGTVTFTSDNNGKAFVTTNTDKSNSTSHPRNATITYSLTDYNTSSSGNSGTLSGSFTIYQDGGTIDDPKDPELTYSWKITSGSEYVSGTKIVSTPVNAKKDNGKYQQYSYQNKYIITVKDNSGTIGSITGTPSISSINNPKPIYKIGTFNISGLSMTPAVNTSDRNITVNTKVSGNYCTNFNVSNPSIDTTVTQAGSSWVPNPTVVGKLSITCENPQTDKIDQSNPASFKIRQLSSNDYSTSLSNVTLSKGNNEFGYRFGTISASSTNISVSGKIKVEESANKTFGISGESKSLISLYPETLTFTSGYSKKVDDIKWKLKFTPDTTQNNKQITNVNSSEITVTQTGIPQGSEMTYNPLTISGVSSADWLTVTNSCTFNYNDYSNYTRYNPNKMTLNADPNRTSVDEITVTDTTNSNIYDIKISKAHEAVSRNASVTLKSSDSKTTLEKTTISGFSQSGETINCTVSLSYTNPNGVNNKYVNLIGTSLSISDTKTHSLNIPRGTTGHTNNIISNFTAEKNGSNDKLTITTNDNAETLWWKANSSVNVGLTLNATGTNLGKYSLNKDKITVSIPGDSTVTPSIKWYAKSTANGDWAEISSESSKLSINVSGNAASATASSPSVEKRNGVGLFDNPFKITRGKPSYDSSLVYYKVESNTGGYAGNDNSVYVERTDGNNGFGSKSIYYEETNIIVNALKSDNFMEVTESDLHGDGSDPNTMYKNWYKYGPTIVLLRNPGFYNSIKEVISRNLVLSNNTLHMDKEIPEKISGLDTSKTYIVCPSVSGSITAKWKLKAYVRGMKDSVYAYDEGVFTSDKYYRSEGHDGHLVEHNIVFGYPDLEWDNGSTATLINWVVTPKMSKTDYTESISCKVTVMWFDTEESSDTITWSTKILATDIVFEGEFRCSDDKTITAFDNDKTYDTSAWIDNYKVTAKSGSKTKDITSDYPISSILNSTSKKLTAVIGTSGTDKGDAKYTYKLTIPNITTANVKNNITGGTEKTVHLYCYGKSYYNG